MVNGTNLIVETEYVTASIPSKVRNSEQIESGYASATSPQSDATKTKISRPKTSKYDVRHARAASSHRSNYSVAGKRNTRAEYRKTSPEVRGTVINGYQRLKTAHSRISAEKLPYEEFKVQQPYVMTNRSRILSTPSKPKQEQNVANYPDDWESDYSDDWESDIDEDNKTLFTPKQSECKHTQTVDREANIPFQFEEEMPKSTIPNSISQAMNHSEHSETRTDNKPSIKEISQPTDPNVINLIPIDPDAFNEKFCEMRQQAINNLSYRTAVNSWKAKQLDDVVKLILELSCGKNLIDRAWIVFYWVSQNIQYDIDAYFSGNIRHQTADDIFRNGKGVCDAFGTIFEILCNKVQLQCEKISGYAKGYSFKNGQKNFNRTNHAWNAVCLYNHWYLVDPTWGEGHMDSSNRAVKELTTFYFLVRPEQMIYRHLPENPKWQFLTPSISMNDFLCLPNVYPNYFELGLNIIHPKHSSTVLFNAMTGYAEILLQSPLDVKFTVGLQQKGYRDDNTHSLVHYDTDLKLWRCLFAPHRGGLYEALIFARGTSKGTKSKSDDDNSYSCVVEFALHVPNDFQAINTFPTTYGLFTERKCQIFEPLHGSLKTGSKVLIHCRIPGAYCARILVDGDWLSENVIKDGILKREITVPKREVTIYAQFSDKRSSSSYDGLFKYSVQ